MRLRSVLSWVSALLLLVCAASCSRREEQPKAPEKAAVPALSPESQKLVALLPDNNAVPGWTRGAEVRFFGPDNLFELINGASENFLIYGFKQVVTADYSNPQNSSAQATVEIYEMKDPRNAFGVYASERNPASEFRKIGAEGYLGGTALNFWAGPYYVKMTVFEEKEELKQALVKLGEAVSRKIGAADAVIPEIASFPKADQVPHSERYLAKDVLGQTYFKEGFEATYRKGKAESKIVIVLPGDEAAATEALSKYKQFTGSSGKVAREVSAPGNGGFVGKDSYYGNMAALRDGARIVIALGGPSTDYALAQAAACVKK